MTLRYVNQGIAFYENGLTDELCDTIWSFYYANLDMSRPGITMTGTNVGAAGERWKHTLDQENFVINGEIHPAKERRDQIDEEIYSQLRLVVADYLDKFTYLRDAQLNDTGYLWQMYRKNDGYYKEHVDGQQWVYKVHKRVGAIICYINGVDEGGETYFPYQDLKIKPEKGGVAIFPAHWMYPHQALVPASSDKLIISSFLECRTEYHVHEG